jgi:hypothetical protein
MNKQKRIGDVLFQDRNTKIFAAALISIGIGAVVLKTLGHNPPQADAFSLSEYYRLVPVEEVISSNIVRTSRQWEFIEVGYSGTKAGNIKQLASLNGLVNPEDINCHFVIYNGLGGGDGQIQPTEKWRRQWLAVPDKTKYCSEQTIRICVISDGKISYPTNFQIKRTEVLVESLSRKFDIQSESIYYPDNWW